MSSDQESDEVVDDGALRERLPGSGVFAIKHGVQEILRVLWMLNPLVDDLLAESAHVLDIAEELCVVCAVEGRHESGAPGTVTAQL